MAGHLDDPIDLAIIDRRVLGATRDIDGDDIRRLVVAGAATLWSGQEGMAQHELAVRNTAA